MKICVSPGKREIPKRGGVRRHLLSVYEQINRHFNVELSGPHDADLFHVESSFTNKKVDLYVCHGGFVPTPLRIVLRNMESSRIIISVAKWIVDEYFPSDCREKTIVIPTGIDLHRFKNVQDNPSGFDPGYILYAKEYPYYFEDVMRLAHTFRGIHLVTTVWDNNYRIPKNVDVIGLQTDRDILSFIKDASFLFLPGSEVNSIMLLEAWALGTPVVARDFHGCAETMCIDFDSSHVIGGMLYHASNKSLIKAVEYVMYNSMDLGKQGQEYVRKYRNWDKLFEQYVEVYKQLYNS